MSNAEFDLVTKSCQFCEKEATYWKALEFARKRHEGQIRNEGTPYFSHIESTIEILRQCGKISDYIFTIAALHDVLEDTDTTKEELFALLCNSTKYDDASGCRDIIVEVELLTKSGDTFKEYIDRIFDDKSIKRERYRYNGAKIVKLADRLHNLTTLHLCGKPEKIQRYIRETEEFIMPHRVKHKDCEILFERIDKRLAELKLMQN
jgi:(p)ppGpp synthase/HD superfamily hydrolase